MSALLWSDGNQMLLKNWAAQEMNIEENHCGYINGTDGKWYLDKCANGKNYVCKTTTGKSVQQTTAIAETTIAETTPIEDKLSEKNDRFRGN